MRAKESRLISGKLLPANRSSERMRAFTEGSRIAATRSSKESGSRLLKVGVPLNGFWLPSSPNRMPIGRGGKTGRMLIPSACASRERRISTL